MTAPVTPTKDKQAILYHVAKGCWLQWLAFGNILRFIPTHMPLYSLPYHMFMICSNLELTN